MHSVEWTAPELRAWLRTHQRSPARSWTDWYYLGFAAVILGTMGVSLVSKVQLPLLTCAPGSAICLTMVNALPLHGLPNFTSGIVLTELGPVPVAALWNALTGFDTALAMAAMVLSSASPILCAGLATLTLLWAVHTAARAAR